MADWPGGRGYRRRRRPTGATRVLDSGRHARARETRLARLDRDRGLADVRADEIVGAALRDGVEDGAVHEAIDREAEAGQRPAIPAQGAAR